MPARKITSQEQRVVDFIRGRMTADFGYAYEVLARFHYRFAVRKFDNVDAMSDFAGRFYRWKGGLLKLSDKQMSYITKLATRFVKQYFLMMQSAATGNLLEHGNWGLATIGYQKEDLEFMQRDHELTFSAVMASEDEKLKHSACRILVAETLKKL